MVTTFYNMINNINTVFSYCLQTWFKLPFSPWIIYWLDKWSYLPAYQKFISQRFWHRQILIKASCLILFCIYKVCLLEIMIGLSKHIAQGYLVLWVLMFQRLLYITYIVLSKFLTHKRQTWETPAPGLQHLTLAGVEMQKCYI